METKQLLSQKHNFFNEAKFRVKVNVFIGRRICQNLVSPLKKYADSRLLIDGAVVGSSERELWNKNDNAQNWILTAGKIENLRIAARKLNGIEVQANEVFSFWRHIGNPNFGQGFVVGREIREGCIVPTIAGGLCQLSNALYDAALKANFQIIERHRHTKVIKGSLAEQDKDATVKWNYVDLRFKSKHAFRIEVELSADKLLLAFKSKVENREAAGNEVISFQQSNKLNDCYSCGNTACFRHSREATIKENNAVTTFILDEKWDEYDAYLQSTATEMDVFINTQAFTGWGIWRALKLRLASKLKQNIFSSSIQLDRIIAQKAAKLIPLESTHIVVAQNLLPFLWEQGVLGGRTFDVLMCRLPLQKMHERLDLAHSLHSESKTLNDFRAPQMLVELENKALTRARKIITPHQELAEIFQNKTIKLDWILPSSTKSRTTGTKILFPASALGRKGAYEMKRLAKELEFPLVVAGKASEKEGFWEDVPVEYFNNNFGDIGLVLFPTYIESQPRLLLKAIAMGIPVITTPASGLMPTKQVTVVALGNFEGLKEEVEKQLAELVVAGRNSTIHQAI